MMYKQINRRKPEEEINKMCANKSVTECSSLQGRGKIPLNRCPTENQGGATPRDRGRLMQKESFSDGASTPRGPGKFSNSLKAFSCHRSEVHVI